MHIIFCEKRNKLINTASTHSSKTKHSHSNAVSLIRQTTFKICLLIYNPEKNNNIASCMCQVHEKKYALTFKSNSASWFGVILMRNEKKITPCSSTSLSLFESYTSLQFQWKKIS